MVPMHHLGQLAVPDALDDEQVDADRRRNLSELDVDDEDDAEQDRIDAVTGEHRIEQRHRDHDHAEALDQAAEHREQHEQHQVELELAELQADDELGDLLAEPGEAQRRREDVGGQDQEQDVAGEDDGVEDRLDEALQRQVAHGDAEQDRQEAADHGRLGGGDDAEVKPAERTEDQENERGDLGERAQQLGTGARPCLARRHGRIDLGVDGDVDHEAGRHDQARDDAGDEQLRHRRLREGAVDDHREARRYQDAERAAGRERACRERPVVAAAEQLRQRDAADRRRGGDARSVDRCEDRAARDVGLQQAAGQRRHQLGEAAIDAVAQTADTQDLGHEHEQRHRGEREHVHAAPAHQAEAVERRYPALQQQIDDGRDRDGERHRHPGGEQAEKQDRDDQDLEFRTHCVPGRCFRETANAPYRRPSTARSRGTAPRCRSPSRSRDPERRLEVGRRALAEPLGGAHQAYELPQKMAQKISATSSKKIEEMRCQRVERRACTNST